MRSRTRHSLPPHSPLSVLSIGLILVLAGLTTVTGCFEGVFDNRKPRPSWSWRSMESGTEVALRDVWGSTASDVFAVGDNGTILHFDGSAWSLMSSGTRETLRGVSGSASDDVFVSGDNGTVLHFDGSVWAALDPGTTDDLGAVDASSSAVTCVNRDAPGLFRVYERSPVPGFGRWLDWDTGTGVVINDFGLIPDEHGDRRLDPVLFTVGDGGVATYHSGGFEPLQAGSSDLVSVFGTAPGNAYVLDAEGTLWHFRGVASGAPVVSVGAPLADAVQRAYDDIMLFGKGGKIFQYDRCGATEMRSGVTSDLLAAWAEPGGEVFAAGVGGTIVRYRKSPERSCPDNIVVRVGPGPNPRITWSPPCPLSKVIVTDLEGFGQGNWFIASDGNHIRPGFSIGEVPDCASELHPAISPLEPGGLYRLTLIRRDIEGDLAVGFYNFRVDDDSQVIAPASGGPELAPASGDGVYVQRVRFILEPAPGEPWIMQFAETEWWLGLESRVDGIGLPDPVVIRALVRDPETGQIQIIQLDDVPVMQIGFNGNEAYAVLWPRLTP